jgi:hypothetical protein
MNFTFDITTSYYSLQRSNSNEYNIDTDQTRKGACPEEGWWHVVRINRSNSRCPRKFYSMFLTSSEKEGCSVSQYRNCFAFQINCAILFQLSFMIHIHPFHLNQRYRHRYAFHSLSHAVLFSRTWRGEYILSYR